jgi:hypothetical protein
MNFLNESRIKISNEKIVKMKKEYYKLIDANNFKLNKTEIELNEFKCKRDVLILELEAQTQKLKQKNEDNKENLS